MAGATAAIAAAVLLSRGVSLSVSGSKILENLALQTDRFLIGRYRGAASLGLFGLARTIVRIPLRYLLNVSDGVLLSGLAALQSDRAAARQYYVTALRIELAILGPSRTAWPAARRMLHQRNAPPRRSARRQAPVYSNRIAIHASSVSATPAIASTV